MRLVGSIEQIDMALIYNVKGFILEIWHLSTMRSVSTLKHPSLPISIANSLNWGDEWSDIPTLQLQEESAMVWLSTHDGRPNGLVSDHRGFPLTHTVQKL